MRNILVNISLDGVLHTLDNITVVNSFMTIIDSMEVNDFNVLTTAFSLNATKFLKTNKNGQ